MPNLAVVWSPEYEVDIGRHVFPTRKYRLVRARLLDEAAVPRAAFREPEPATDEDVLLVHTPAWVEAITRDALSPVQELQLEVPYTPALRESMWRCAGGTTLTGRLALDRGLAAHLGGGFHHAFPDHGEGFCLINDVAIAVRALQRDAGLRRAMVVDLDVHHGNGTAAVFADDPEVFTLSFHQEHNYPAWKPPSDLDVAFPDRTGDTTYLQALERHLPAALERHQPALVFYLAGADPYHDDQLGGLALTLEGLRRRDATVLRFLRARGIPVAITLAGGYAHHPDDTVEIHCGTIREAAGLAAG